VLIQPGQPLADLEVLFSGSPGSSDQDQGEQRDVPGAVAAVERQRRWSANGSEAFGVAPLANAGIPDV
jgi:hypothetical protein